MYATGHGDGKCKPNPKLVAALIEVNKRENDYPRHSGMKNVDTTRTS
jgi:hypothetical protein